jgi:hypothetical protein
VSLGVTVRGFGVITSRICMGFSCSLDRLTAEVTVLFRVKAEAT